MKKAKIIFSFLFLMMSIFSFAQKNKTTGTVAKSTTPTTTPAKTVCDCKDAIKINIQKTTKYGFTVAPDGYGTVQEITEINKQDKYAFEKEHNTAWYQLQINQDGDFVFDIAPTDSSNDYDFLLFRYTDTSTCNNILTHKLKPVRSNLTRGNKPLKGFTGLSLSAKKEFVGKGPGDAYSKFINVKKGEKYLLVLDNVYPEGKGHTLYFAFEKEVEISGTVLNDDSLGVKADVALVDNTGKTVAQVKTDKYGKYGFRTDMKENMNYNLTYTSDSGFTQVRTLNTMELKDNNTFKDIRTILPKLRKGSKYKMGSINFFGDQATLLPESVSSVEALVKLMKKNKKMKIIIEGHVNGTGGGSVDIQKLSEERAKTVYNFLLKNDIDKDRMSTVGYGAKRMIYPQPMTEWEMAANRRVEINVVSIE
ncbi:MAG: OmpA family protein [Bacteroidota bacterium]